ncbi:hypothetical protein [Nocardiopsis dassonvillei]|uniref:hypothetical protein n=1 Tax=Nocardiopsis dassonvillei TaxID=2014 RepID=UPI00363D3B5F
MATTATKADAKNRSARTSAQNLLGAILSVSLVAGSGAVIDTVTPGDLIDWATLGAAGTAVIGAVASYVHRLVDGDAAGRE